jgi:hypothetical protein
MWWWRRSDGEWFYLKKNEWYARGEAQSPPAAMQGAAAP